MKKIACLTLALTACTQPAPHFTKLPLVIPGVEETSPLVVNGKVVIMASQRTESVVGTKITFTDLDGNELASIPTDIACASARTNPDGSITLVGVKNADKPGSSVIELTLNTHLEVIKQRLLYTGIGQVIYNVSLEGDILAYEVPNDASGHPRIYFRDVEANLPLGNIFDNKGQYATTPTLRKVGAWYYLLFTATQKTSDGSYQLYSAASRTLNFLQWSDTREIFSLPKTCACDPDIVEFEGKTYMTYDVGSQQNGLGSETTHISVFNGTLADLFGMLF